MKKLLIACFLGLFLFSCGKSACDCKEEFIDLGKEIANAFGDKEKSDELAEKNKKLTEACKEYKKEDYERCK